MFQSILDRELRARIKAPDADDVRRLSSQDTTEVNSHHIFISDHQEDPTFC